ncbi:MAG: helix-turn-helix domain-containing protein [Chloroflexi bacterium]|nr:helix-turn-helix domain-containing protein [Chloroflexota bacterium]
MVNLDVISIHAYNKSMDREKVAKHERVARRTRNVSEMHIELDPRYDINVFSGREITDTGRLDVGELTPKGSIGGTLPRFAFRWDEKDDALDVDLDNVSEAEIMKFIKGTPDYYGHHTTKISSSGRVFEADIVWQGQKIYKGHISFNLEFEQVLFDGISMAANASYSVEEAAKLSKISSQHIRYLLSKGEILGKKLGRDWVVLSLDYIRKRKPKERRSK